ncbi:TetR/AcrR family transcriptional regulator [Dietzia sp. CQ4]|uniref:TetR/AcrR family transcriptional regulator n=1 Tax=Dietzia TaxID=37914 RepID=UPI0015FB712B|nr:MULTISPECIES: TetR/AcrR family transcriptional regulator [Dietzia]MBB1034452.1 TetR/AcrR family transcriptional regulator [Dietzia sp. CQ4]MBB1036920.1 TetR/AcrR family transcriptional regulator [Dietzia natronolimnaea]MBB1039926.1 TetR/AcrR family transcriptional regulator [Dietzia sp. Cai40]MBB1044567.1 TetR/AcrR family transcriptional regulator [Dietzia sp. DQ11-44]
MNTEPSRRDSILAAAAEYFAEQGYHSAGMRGIADSVGIKGASLYNHFSSKEEILYAIALKMTRVPVEEHLLVLDEAGTPAERLTSLVDVHLRHLAVNRVEHLVSLRELSALTEDHRERVVEYRKYYQRRVRDVIAAGIRAGEFGVDDPLRAAVAVLDLMNGVSWWLRDDYDIDALVSTYVDYIVNGILGPRRGVRGGAAEAAR